MNRLSACGTFNGRSTSAFSTLKTMALAPMASASVSMAVTANPGDLRNWRKASRRSAITLPPLSGGVGTVPPLARAGWRDDTLVRKPRFHLFAVRRQMGQKPRGHVKTPRQNGRYGQVTEHA